MNKERYLEFCEKEYIQIYSKPWWLDAVCGKDNWDVWLYESGGNILAAMPYYMENRNGYKYITKAPLTQVNGIIFAEDARMKRIAIAEREEKIIQAACEFINSLCLDVYEQQFPYTFTNWQPFFWNSYTNVLRYTYVIENTSSPEMIMEGMSANYRKNVRKGQRLTKVVDNITKDVFYREHKKVFDKQGIPVPITEEFWNRFYNACQAHNTGKIIAAIDVEEKIHSVMYLVWDERAMYPILGGYMPEFSSSQSYPALTYYSICMAGKMGKIYDFEGSMIKQIAKSFREYGGVPMPYYRIRKVFNPDIVRMEAEQYIKRLENEQKML